MLRGKRAQASDTLVWIIATIAIVVILVSFLYLSSFFGKTMRIAKAKGEIFSKESNPVQEASIDNSVYSYFMAKDSLTKEKIYSFYKDNELFRKRFSEIGRNIG